MSLKEVITKLSELGKQAKTIRENLAKEIESNKQKYAPEYCHEVNEKVKAEVNSKLERLKADAQNLVDKEIALRYSELDASYFKNITPEQFAELEMISKSDVTILEMKKYYEKFSDNYAILRRLEKIAIDKGYRVLGRSYLADIEQVEELERAFPHFINAIHSGDAMRLLTSESLVNNAVEEYTMYMDKLVEIVSGQ